MLTKQRVSTTLEARCSGCGCAYPEMCLPFLYADELGARCPGCGSILIVGNDENEPGKVRNSYSLMISGRLEGSGLHGRLIELTQEREGFRVLVDRTSETRTVRLATAAPAMESGTLQ
jgi:hypothetical protein